MDQLEEGWLVVELEMIDRDVEGWSEGLKESFDSLLDSSQNDAYKQIDFKD